ncbi:MAG TPA: hypothetical protein VLG11_04975 [Candidatus Saccharimonadales bacterium]|nr:hypothetical protein [Candidatus Saccharimonadales bacterium]
MHYLILFGIVLVVGLIPAFGPPSFIFAIYFYHKYHLAFWAVVLVTAFATTLGRLLLALLARQFKNRIPARYLRNLDYSKQLIVKRQNAAKFGVGLFLLSPLPSAQLFEAAGLLDIKLMSLGAAFFVGRLISLTTYLAFSHLAITNITRLWENGFSSWWAILFEITAILLLLAMFRMHEIVGAINKRRQKYRK